MSQAELPSDDVAGPEPQGCLAALLRLFGIRLPPAEVASADDRLPYRLTQRFLSAAELLERDDFVDRAFAAAGSDVLHVKVRTSYVLEDIRSQVHAALEKKEAPSVVAASKGSTPDCPNCRTPMIQRTASKGPQKGNQFWGCENYPNCRATVPIR